jgi:antitoxin Phd
MADHTDHSSANWQLQEAKARFSELVKRAREQGPQHVSVRGEPAVVVISEKEFAKLVSPRSSIVDHILEGRALAGRSGRLHQCTPARHRARCRSLMYLVDTNVLSEARRGNSEA